MEKWKTRIIWREPDFTRVRSFEDSEDTEALPTMEQGPRTAEWQRLAWEQKRSQESTVKTHREARCMSTEETLPEQLELG